MLCSHIKVYAVVVCCQDECVVSVGMEQVGRSGSYSAFKDLINVAVRTVLGGWLGLILP